MENPTSEIPLVSDANPILGGATNNPAAAALAAVQGKRRGRHPKDCPCDKCNTRRATGGGSPAAVGQKTLTESEKKLAKETCVALTHVMDTVALVVFRRHLSILPEGQQRIILGKIPMSEPLRQGIGESGALVAEKHGVAANLPEFTLCAYLTAYVSSLSMLVWETKQYMTEYAKLKAESEKDASNGPKR